MSERPDSIKRTTSRRWRLRLITISTGILLFVAVPVFQRLQSGDWPQRSSLHLTMFAGGLLFAAAACLPHHWNKRFLLVGLSSLLALITLEMLLGLVIGQEATSLYVWNDSYLYKLKPESSKKFRRTRINGGEVIDVQVNRQGLRGPDINPESTAPRLLVCGDSNIFAEFSQLKDTFVEQLRIRLTNSIGVPLEVLNAGTVGYGPDQILLRLEEDLPRFKPTIVVVSLFADNDLGDLLRNKLFLLNQQQELIPHQWKLSPGCQRPGQRIYEPLLWKLTRHAIRGTQSQWGKSTSFMDRWLQQCRDEYEQYVLKNDPWIRDLEADHYDADNSLLPEAESSKYKRRLLDRVLKKLRTVCETHRTELFIMVIPSPADLIPNFEFYEIDTGRFPNYQPEQLSQAISSLAKAHGISHINLFPTFATNSPKTLYFRGGDNHWNDAGQALAARVVATQLINEFPQNLQSDETNSRRIDGTKSELAP